MMGDQLLLGSRIIKRVVKKRMLLDDNSLTCDSAGNCMMADDLWSAGIKTPFGSGHIKTADNILRCDSAGSCMMGDQLLLGSRIIKRIVKKKMLLDDNSLTCDSAGNCMMDDSL
jgi:uncharacterized Fe-S cluster protein YjdI